MLLFHRTIQQNAIRKRLDQITDMAVAFHAERSKRQEYTRALEKALK